MWFFPNIWRKTEYYLLYIAQWKFSSFPNIFSKLFFTVHKFTTVSPGNIVRLWWLSYFCFSIWKLIFFKLMFIYYLCGRENEGNCKNLRCFGQKNDDIFVIVIHLTVERVALCIEHDKEGFLILASGPSLYHKKMSWLR